MLTAGCICIMHFVDLSFYSKTIFSCFFDNLAIAAINAVVICVVQIWLHYNN